jgi:hypothetical protein
MSCLFYKGEHFNYLLPKGNLASNEKFLPYRNVGMRIISDRFEAKTR